MATLTLTRPDDWHLHLRDGPMLRAVLPQTTRCFGRALVMPNLKPPVTRVEQARAYRERILAALPKGARFEPLMTLYLTEDTTKSQVREARDSGLVHGFKLYPAGATTHSEAGVGQISRCSSALAEMERVDLPLLVHGEVTDPTVDVFDRERVFLERVLEPLVRERRGLRVVFEHISTREAAEFVAGARVGVAATVTAHHLLLCRDALFAGGLRPHHYCLPVLKGEEHRRAVLAAATSGSPRFFLGTDSAPHPRSAKERSGAAAGIFSAPAALELYAEAFFSVGALERLEAFASFHGADFYRLPRNTGTLVLEQGPWRVTDEIPTDAGEAVVPLRAGTEVSFRVRAREGSPPRSA